MRVLVMNAGSSSLKYQLFDMEGQRQLAKGLCDRIGQPMGRMTHTAFSVTDKQEMAFADHPAAVRAMVDALTTGERAVIRGMGEIDAIGHRVAQGAEKLIESVQITPEVLAQLEEVSPLAPLHNPAQIQAMRACEEVFGAETPQVAVFDTAFHQTMPPKAYLFNIPRRFHQQYGVRRYGFHGTSHKYVSSWLRSRPNPPHKLVSCHLGNGSSITAIQDGHSIDTSMGFTPLDGLIMGTRSGTVDPSIIPYLAQKENRTAEEILQILNKESGLLGVSDTTSDARDLYERALEGDDFCRLAYDMMIYQITKYIGSYTAAMNGMDALLFTGGIGENGPEVRRDVCRSQTYLGLELDEYKNEIRCGFARKISTPNSRVEVWVVPTNEELAIAQETQQVLTHPQ